MDAAAASSISIRRAAPGDATVLARLYRAEVEAQRAWSGDSFSLRPDFDWLAWVSAKLQAANTAVFVAERNGVIVGFAEARIRQAGPASGPPQRGLGWRDRLRRLLLHNPAAHHNAPPASPLEPRSTGFIEEVFVDPDARRQGIALALLDAAKAWLLGTGAAELLASIWWGNDASRALMAKAGLHASRVVVRGEGAQ